MRTAFFTIAATVFIFSGMTSAHAFDVYIPSVSMPSDTSQSCINGVCVTKGK